MKSLLVILFLLAPASGQAQVLSTPDGTVRHVCNFPVYYSLDFVPLAEIATAFKRAAERWNNSLKFPLFAEVPFDVERTNVVVLSSSTWGGPPKIGPPLAEETLAQVFVTMLKKGCWQRGTVIYSVRDSFMGTTRDMWAFVFSHELGHVLGLAHSTEPANLMRQAVPSALGPGAYGKLTCDQRRQLRVNLPFMRLPLECN